MALRDKFSDLRGILVVDYEHGEQLGKVQDIFINRNTKQIMGISFRAGIFTGDELSYAAMDDIHKIGKDVIIIANRHSATEVPPELQKDSLRALKNLPVTTIDGEQLGELVDIHVDTNSGQIREIFLSSGKKLEIEVESVSFGLDAIIVPGAYASQFQHIEQSRPGILGRLYQTTMISETVKETSQNVGQRVRSTAEKMSELMKQSFKKRESHDKQHTEKKHAHIDDNLP